MTAVSEVSDLRRRIDKALDAGLALEARYLLMQMALTDRAGTLARFRVSRYERLPEILPMTRHRLMVLRSFTVETMVPFLRAQAFDRGVNLQVSVAPLNSHTQLILDPSSELYRCSPDTVILALQARDLIPEIWHDAASLSEQDLETRAHIALSELASLLKAFRARSDASIILHTLELPYRPSNGVLDAQTSTGQTSAIMKINRGLQILASEYHGVYLLDYENLVSRYGKDSWHDERRWLSSRLPIKADHLPDLANEWLRFLVPLSGRVCKALVVDLDNTLWGGVVGEDGPEGLQLGPDYPGTGFLDLQRAILDLYERGVILAIASKNNEADAMEVLEKHQTMLLRPHHFASLRINWNDKAGNLRGIADELNIGLDALAFLDDNPVEREFIRTQIPEVTVIELPDDPGLYARTLRAEPVFERLTLSDEDRERGRYYATDRLRNNLAETSYSIEDFYRSLEMEVTLAECTPDALTRVAQLTQKTNQFNLTTHRYTEQQIATLMESDEWDVLTVRVKDRFGDNGLVGVLIGQSAEDYEIETLLMSCRVMGRTVETGILSAMSQLALSRGCKSLSASYVPTKKNVVVADLYSSHGFECTETTDQGTRWRISPAPQVIPMPAWLKFQIEVREPAGALS